MSGMLQAFVDSGLPNLQRIPCLGKRRQYRAPRCSIDSRSIQRTTLAWARRIVVGLHLCPFAESVLDSDTLRVTVCEATAAKGVREEISGEIEHLLWVSPEILTTTLIVTPNFAEDDFVRFDEFCNGIDEVLRSDDGLFEKVVLAWFHPEFAWGDIEEEDVVNFDKRAPYPMINLLRGDQVDEYISKGKTQHIVDANKKTLNRVGLERMTQLYRELSSFE